MATSAGTEPADVRVDFATHLSDDDVLAILDRIEREIDREYDAASDVTFEDTQHRKDFEAALTQLRIATGRDRRADSVQSGRSSTEYETSEVAAIRQRVRRLDPGEVFGRSSRVVRDDTRHSTTTEH